MTQRATLLIDCPDREGLVAGVVNLLVREYDANILDADQHKEATLGLSFLRVEFTTAGATFDACSFARAIAPMAEDYSMHWRLDLDSAPRNVAIFVSGYLHCLADLLLRYQAGEFRGRIALILSNHEAARSLAAFHDIPFHYMPITPETKPEVKARQRSLLTEHNVELIVLARYMQVLSSGFTEAYPHRIINVHHSLLPAFIGARPHQAAFGRGVKLVGATSHYATAELDEGPIIEQEVARVSHKDQLPAIIQKGRDLERLVLARAVQWHLDHRILTYANKTVIFN